MSYQGWKTKATWDLHLWLNEDPYFDEICGALINHVSDNRQLADNLKDVATEYIYNQAWGEDQESPGDLASQLLLTAIDDIDWHEIATHRFEQWLEQYGDDIFYEEEEEDEDD